MPAREIVFIGIGSNLGDSMEHCRTAGDLMAQNPDVRLTGRSPLYQTEPYGITEQPAFMNAVIRAETCLSPRVLLDLMLSIEKAMGRERREKWGPRIIDLDLLFYGDRVIEEAGLQVPHPDMAGRSFVLAPLCDLAPDWVHPVLNRTVRELLEGLGDVQSAQRLDSKLWRREG